MEHEVKPLTENQVELLERILRSESASERVKSSAREMLADGKIRVPLES